MNVNTWSLFAWVKRHDLDAVIKGNVVEITKTLTLSNGTVLDGKGLTLRQKTK